MQRNQLVNMIYVSKSGIVTKRRIKIIKIVGDSFQVFCFTRNEKRTFIINNGL
ncbi:transcriptional regulator [Lysinibacillus sp. NPDC048646]|uniref:transcriptional regulator n=1 Tax=Lysinibacillus sp. NPDC048646 TaxID=3390574 RepID=UPI003CFE05C3